MDTSSPALTEALRAAADDFAALGTADRLQLLLEYSRALPDPPARYGEHPELLEQVVECQSPLFVAVELDTPPGARPSQADPVRLYFSAPEQAPTTRGFAGILHEGLDGATAAQVLAVPADLAAHLALAEAVSPLRVRGMTAMLARIQRQVRARLAG